MWFQNLTGFEEKFPEQVRSKLILTGQEITSKVNGKSWMCGSLEIPSLAELRQKSQLSDTSGTLRVSELIGNVQDFHLNPVHAGALFQAASQFNLLEMTGPGVNPESGIDIYEFDRTQGPACAIACGAGTMYRNYFVELDGQIGQSSTKQIDCLKDLGDALGNEEDRLWKMRNGYSLFTSLDSLKEIARNLANTQEPQKDRLRGKLQIGIQWNTQVTPNECTHTVSQAYCSALPVAYNSYPSHVWKDFAQLVLEASYEATLHAALINSRQTGNNKVFLTFLGGGAFGNQEDWIFTAIKRALLLFAQTPLDIYFVSYGDSHPRMDELTQLI